MASTVSSCLPAGQGDPTGKLSHKQVADTPITDKIKSMLGSETKSIGGYGNISSIVSIIEHCVLFASYIT